MQFPNTTFNSPRIIFAVALFVLSAPIIAVPMPLSHTVSYPCNTSAHGLDRSSVKRSLTRP
ncbi:uncharacterized protein Bfra_004573 [Botrytis fragariae]|uniref:Uncharacterized protein n=1 Tax=Botrytis fragariae TaxID=1964551 RepID=A0A8H6EJI7_9HELO|nr:uncharacterized protein Bfra_004573 [Botrytis fragariae]KAF5874562.1 hypothetical protein Bfra_004573 [Botrytis fragariae]